MRTLSPHTAPVVGVVCVSDLRIKLPVAICVGMVHMIFSGSPKGTHTSPNEIFELTYPDYVQSLRPLLRTQVVSYPCNYTLGIYEVCTWYIVFVVPIIIFVCVVLAHRSQKLFDVRPSSVRQHFQMASSLKLLSQSKVYK